MIKVHASTFQLFSPRDLKLWMTAGYNLKIVRDSIDLCTELKGGKAWRSGGEATYLKIHMPE